VSRTRRWRRRAEIRRTPPSREVHAAPALTASKEREGSEKRQLDRLGDMREYRAPCAARLQQLLPRFPRKSSHCSLSLAEAMALRLTDSPSQSSQ